MFLLRGILLSAAIFSLLFLFIFQVTFKQVLCKCLFTSCHYFFDPILTKSCSEEIKNSLLNSSKEKISFEKISSDFPMISEIVYNRYGFFKSYVAIKAYKPWFCLKNNLILLSNGKIIQNTIMEPLACDRIDSLLIDQSAMSEYAIDKRFCQWLFQIPPNIFKNYEVALRHPYYITIKNQHWLLLCDYTSKIDEQVINKYSEIFLRAKTICAEIKNNLQWVIDIRFNKQIIIYRSKGREP